MVEGEEHRLHHILHIHERDVLALEAHAEVYMLLDALRHEEIVFLTRAVDARGTEHNVVELVADGVEKLLGLELALAVGGVGARRVVLSNLLVGLLFAYGPEDAQAAQVDEAPHGHLRLQDGVHQVHCALVVHLHEIGSRQALGDARSMHHIVEVVTVERLRQTILRREIKLYEMDARIAQVAPRTRTAHTSPGLEAAAQCLLHYETANESTGTGN